MKLKVQVTSHKKIKCLTMKVKQIERHLTDRETERQIERETERKIHRQIKR
jgi:hypothetical protein